MLADVREQRVVVGLVCVGVRGLCAYVRGGGDVGGGCGQREGPRYA